MWTLRTLGGLALERDGKPGSGAASQRVPLSILAFIAAAGDAGASRDRLTAIFWPESDTERARGSLKQALYGLKRSAGGQELTLGNAVVKLNGALVDCDVVRFVAAVAAQDWQSAERAYGGVFLDGVHVAGNVEFERWLDRERAKLAHDYAAALESLAGAADARGDFTGAAEWWHRLATSDILSARIARGYIEALARTGDRDAAIRYAQLYESMVRAELDTDPDPSIAALVARLRSSSDVRISSVPPAVSRAEAEELPGELSQPPLQMRRVSWRRAVIGAGLAVVLTIGITARLPRPEPAAGRLAGGLVVLPCADRAQNAATSGDRWAEELIGKLARVDGLTLRSWETSSRYRNSRLSDAQVGIETNAAIVVRCAVEGTQDSMRFKVEMVRASDEGLILSREYGPAGEINAVNSAQAAAASDIATILGLSVTPTMFSAINRPLTQDSIALRLYRLGRYFEDKSDYTRSRSYYEAAIARDSTFALAHVALSGVLFSQAETERTPSRSYYPRMGALARRGMELDPSIAMAHTLLGDYLLNFTLDWAGADAEHRKALQLDPNSPSVLVGYGWYLFQTERLRESLPVFQKAVASDPTSVLAIGQVIRVLNYLGRRDDALRLIRQSLELQPDWEPFTHHLASILISQGKTDSALSILDRTPPVMRVATTWLYSKAGHPEKARALLDSVLTHASERPVDAAHVAWLYVSIGQDDKALDWLDSAYAERANLLIMLLGPHPAFDHLRGRARFVALRKQAGFPR
jgi:DNA-binding SARP family transcriptional activator/Tfp pilus assembly protein PilF/TolB-like protein